jgi:hypothetical protein
MEGAPMPTLKIDLTWDTFDRLAAIAFQERRPIPLQIEVLVMQAVGLWPPQVATEAGASDAPTEGGARHAAAYDR